MSKFSAFTEANNKFADNHPNTHIALVAIGAVVWIVGMNKLARKLAQKKTNPYIVK